MRLDRTAIKYRTGFSGRLVAEGDDNIERLAAKFVPRLTAITRHRNPFCFKRVNRHWMYGAGREAAGAISDETILAEMIEQPLSHDAAAGIAGADKQHFSYFPHGWTVLHLYATAFANTL